MKPRVMMFCLLTALALGFATAQTAKKSPAHEPETSATTPEKSAPAETTDDDIQQLNADVQRLRVLLTQMRSNLAFVQSSQTPLKHQFELETDAWQVLIEQMERRLQRIKDRGTPPKSTPHSEDSNRH